MMPTQLGGHDGESPCYLALENFAHALFYVHVRGLEALLDADVSSVYCTHIVSVQPNKINDHDS